MPSLPTVVVHLACHQLLPIWISITLLYSGWWVEFKDGNFCYVDNCYTYSVNLVFAQILYFWLFIKNILYGFLLCSPVIGLDLESVSHSREKVQFFKTRLRIFVLALTWRDEIEIITWPFSYFETRTRLNIVTLMFTDKIDTLENHFSWSSEKKWMLLSSRIPGIENSRWPLAHRHTVSRFICLGKAENGSYPEFLLRRSRAPDMVPP